MEGVRLAAHSRLFSSAVIQQMATSSKSPLFARLAKDAFEASFARTFCTVADAFEAAFEALRAVEHRDEYVYKAALTHRVLLGTHSLTSASMLTEFRVANRKADLVILNGTATVYEIKSERDSLARLGDQLRAYGLVFPKRYVVTGENHVNSVLAESPPEVGVLLLSGRYHISTIREAREDFGSLCQLTMCESLRADEARQVLLNLGVHVPAVPNTQLRTELARLFARADARALHEQIVKVLKRSRSLAPLSSFVTQLPRSLQPAILSMPIRKMQHEKLIRALHTDFFSAMEWA